MKSRLVDSHGGMYTESKLVGGGMPMNLFDTLRVDQG